MQSSLFSKDCIVGLLEFLSCLWQFTMGYTLDLTLFILILHIILFFCTKLRRYSHSLNNSPSKRDNECIDMSGNEIVDASTYICNCSVSLCDKLFDTYYCTLYIHLSIILSPVNQLELIIHNITEGVGTKVKDINDKHDKNICQNSKNNQSHCNMYGALMDYTSTLMLV